MQNSIWAEPKKKKKVNILYPWRDALKTVVYVCTQKTFSHICGLRMKNKGKRNVIFFVKPESYLVLELHLNLKSKYFLKGWHPYGAVSSEHWQHRKCSIHMPSKTSRSHTVGMSLIRYICQIYLTAVLFRCTKIQLCKF